MFCIRQVCNISTLWLSNSSHHLLSTYYLARITPNWHVLHFILTTLRQIKLPSQFYREINCIAQLAKIIFSRSHSKWQSWNLNPGLYDSRVKPLTHYHFFFTITSKMAILSLYWKGSIISLLSFSSVTDMHSFQSSLN